MTNIALVSGGIEWTRWTSLSLFKSLDIVQHSFDMTTTDPEREGISRWNVGGGSEVEILMDGDPVFEGFVRRYNQRADGNGSHEINVAGDSRAIDLVEGGHEGPYFWEGSAQQVIDDVLAPYGFSATVSEPLDALPQEGFRVAVNDSPFQILRRIAERNGLLIWTDGGQGLRLSRGPLSLASTSLGPCDYTTIETDYDLTDRFSKIRVKWQRNNFADPDEDAQTKEAIWEGGDGFRYRPLVMIESGPDAARNKLAQYVAHRSAGSALSVNVTCKSPRDPDGNFWNLGHEVYIENSIFGLSDNLIVHSVEFSLTEENGFEARLGLRPRSVYTAVPVSRREARRAGATVKQAVSPISEGTSFNPLEFVP